MPLDLARIVADRALVAIPVAGETVNVHYKPSAITPRFTRDLAAWRSDPERSLDGVCEALAQLIGEWDLVSEGKPYPTTTESLSELPVSFLLDVFSAVLEDSNSRGEARKVTSAAG